ncbi:MAG TPA: glycosyltransferase family 4 protein, partial [Polyangiaceae bacterium]
SDLIGTKPGNTYDRLRRLATYAAEYRILNHYRHVAALTDRLAADIHKIAPRRRPAVLPLGIDASLYPFGADDPIGARTIGIIGNFSWTPTHRAAVRLLTKLWPRIKAKVPDAQLLIVGRDAVLRIGRADPNSDVEIVENVPDIIPYFKRLHVLLYAPAHGSGTKVKVQEAMALGIPVVTNADGGEGIPAKDGEHWGLAEDDEGLIERTIALLNDADSRRARRIAARTLLEVEFGSTRTIGAVLEAYTHIAPATSVEEAPATQRERSQ